jgi:hypothetical protein
MAETQGSRSGQAPAAGRTLPKSKTLPNPRGSPRKVPALREPSSPTPATEARADVDDARDIDVAAAEGPAATDEGPSRIIYVREPRERPELATAVVAIIVTLVAGLVLGASGVLIWDHNKHTDACAQVGPHVVWDQSLYRCVREPAG